MELEGEGVSPFSLAGDFAWRPLGRRTRPAAYAAPEVPWYTLVVPRGSRVDFV